MKKLLFIAALAGLILPASQSMAASYGYGMAGCGLGTQVLRNKPGKGMQMVQVTTNRMGSQTSAITSGSSGCKEDARSMASLYITINYAALMKDVSRGNGETISSLSELYQCNDSATLGTALRTNYQDIFKPQMTNEKASQKIENVIINNKLNCKVLS